MQNAECGMRKGVIDARCTRTSGLLTPVLSEAKGGISAKRPAALCARIAPPRKSRPSLADSLRTGVNSAYIDRASLAPSPFCILHSAFCILHSALKKLPSRSARELFLLAWTVSRILFLPSGRGGHSSWSAVADGLMRPTRDTVLGHQPDQLALPRVAGRGCRCLVLHAVGFAMPALSPARRCALTAPFHPCLCRADPAIGGLFSVALSLTSAERPTRMGVTHHRVLPCSDFPRALARAPAAAASTPVQLYAGSGFGDRGSAERGPSGCSSDL